MALTQRDLLRAISPTFVLHRRSIPKTGTCKLVALIPKTGTCKLVALIPKTRTTELVARKRKTRTAELEDHI
ncbi:MAG: hypothetical protein VYA34_11205, partial [Myxococcota bacterium]|nr:hypothetical protein [Myxococcota bacterium]